MDGMEPCDLPSAPNLESAPIVKNVTKTTEEQAPSGFVLRLGRRVEFWISTLLVVVTLVFMAPIFRGMATTSLSTDERGTVTRYSSRGPLRTMTHYDLAKNHIFFNFLNSMTPGSKSLNSLRVRAWSFVFLAASGAAALLYFARRGWFLEGALWIYFWGVNPELVTLNLMARGYGFLSLVTLALPILAISYFETGNRKALWALCILTALGVWTIPSFLIFGAALLAFLLLATRSREVFIAGAATMAAVAILYAPVLQQVLHVMHQYGGKYGEDYAKMEAVAETLRVYLFPAGDPLLFAVLCGALVSPFALWGRQESVGRALRPLVGAVFVFFAACLAMKTPPLRTAAFAVPALLLCLVHAFGVFFRNPRIACLRPLIALGIALPLTVHATREIAAYRFLPIENWLDVARAIETVFPAGTTTCGGSNTLSAYIPKSYRDLDAFDKEAFLQGKSVVIHAQTPSSHKYDVNVAHLSPRLLNIQISQRIGGFQELWFIPPMESGVTEVTAAEGSPVTGWKLTTPGIVTLKLRPGAPFHSLNVWVKESPALSQLQVEAVVNGTPCRMQSFQSEEGRIFSLRLPEKTLPPVEVRFSSPASGAAVLVGNIWAVPASPAEGSAR